MICSICGIDCITKEIEFEDKMPVCCGCIFERDDFEIKTTYRIEKEGLWKD
jgi:transcription initiation factor TFIIIB Brf1 subunit/transcription initiation factor TFIIB